MRSSAASDIQIFRRSDRMDDISKMISAIYVEYC